MTCRYQGHDNFYGSTTSGGTLGFGGVFHVTIDGTLVALDSFDGVTALSANGLTAGLNGSLYGTSIVGGDLTDSFGIGGGNVFRYTP